MAFLPWEANYPRLGDILEIMRDILRNSIGGSLITEASTWDSIAFDRNVHILKEVVIVDEERFAVDAVAALNGLASEGISLLTTRIASTRTRDLEILQRVGFHVVETTFSPTSDGSIVPPNSSEFVARASKPEELESLIRIAGEAFTVSRFHNDPLIPTYMASRRYENWVESAASSHTQSLWSIVNTSNELAGFFISEIINGEAYWHLTALAREFRGRGLASDIWRTVMQFQRQLGVSRFRTTISAANLPVVNLYPKLGFRLENPQTSLHLHL